MKNTIALTVCLGTISLAQLVLAQPPGLPTPGDEHKWLTKFVGHWEVTSTGTMGEGQPPVESEGTIDSEMLGGFWVTNVMTAEVAGFPFKGIQTIGFDTKREKYVGTWIDSTNGFLWKYEGFVDESGKKLVLEAKGPDMMVPGKMRTYRDAYEFKTDDIVISTSSVKGEDGEWTVFMRGTAKKAKTDSVEE